VIEPVVDAVPREPVELPPPPPSRARTVPPIRAPEPVAVLFDRTIADYAGVASALAAALPPRTFAVTLVPLGVAEEALEHSAAVVAVGREAATRAHERAAGRPIVFCQVFNYQEVLTGPRIWGVHALPPLDLQLRAWKSAVPTLARVGFILSNDHSALAADAARAAAEMAVAAYPAVSSSDRETLYLFKRLAAEIDGLWLFPDNRILSAPVLRELLGYAASHDISVLVNNAALLDWGAALAVSSTHEDVARSVRRVLEAVTSGRSPSVMTPLSEVAVRANRAQRGAARAAEWVLRVAD
jgi:hypothetical protein